MDIPLPWERLLWSGRPALAWPGRERYVLTDFRLVRIAGPDADELLLRDIADIQRSESRLERVFGRSTLSVGARDGRRRPIVLRQIRRGAQLAALVEWLASENGERRAALDARTVRAALAWNPQPASHGYLNAIAGVTAVLLLVFGIAIGLHGKAAPLPAYSPDDPIAPNGHRRTDAEIVRFMEDEVMPWARTTLGPLKGGSDRIRCDTCHGARPELRGWHMPAVARLPQPDVREQGWEQYGGPMDAQIRNAIYGYLAESDKQTRAAYMREIVLPGMARLLHRPAYDFTRPYEYNRSRLAFGCYHCHRVS